jgi:hypothetical protein
MKPTSGVPKSKNEGPKIVGLISHVYAQSHTTFTVHPENYQPLYILQARKSTQQNRKPDFLTPFQNFPLLSPIDQTTANFSRSDLFTPFISIPSLPPHISDLSIYNFSRSTWLQTKIDRLPPRSHRRLLPMSSSSEVFHRPRPTKSLCRCSARTVHSIPSPCA